jgi:hypothetical protein
MHLGRLGGVLRCHPSPPYPPFHQALKSIHTLYVDTFCNPFFSVPLKSPRFDAAVEKLAAGFGAS